MKIKQTVVTEYEMDDGTPIEEVVAILKKSGAHVDEDEDDDDE